MFHLLPRNTLSQEVATTAAKKDYEVGYGRPPVATRFKKGASGNAKGRPKGARGYHTMVGEVLHKKVDVRVDGKSRKLSQLEVAMMQLVKKATAGDAKSIDRILGLAKDHERRTEEFASTKDGSPGVTQLSDSERAMLAHSLRTGMLNERFAPEDIEVTLNIFGIEAEKKEGGDE